MADRYRVLMCRDRPVLEYEYFATGGYALRVVSIFDESRIPLGMYVDGRPEPDGESITSWWRGRGVPVTRDGLSAMLAAGGIESTGSMLDRSMGLSLSDQYWVRPSSRSDLRWKDVNFFHNDFDERLGKALFSGHSSRIDDVNTPDVTSAGDLPKRWVIGGNGVRSLIKGGRTGQEPDNERIAYRVAGLFGIDHIEYRIGRAQGRRVSVCDEMLSDREELIPGGQIRRIFRDGRNSERKTIWLEACERLGVDRDAQERATDDFLFLDFLLRNTDRHYNNFGLIRDVESLAVRPAPVFDSGDSLWNGLEPDMMSNDDYPAKPFWIDDWGDSPNAYHQLASVRDWDRYDLSALEAVPDIVRDQLATNVRMSPVVIDAICAMLLRRIPLIREIRNRSVASTMTVSH